MYRVGDDFWIFFLRYDAADGLEHRTSKCLIIAISKFTAMANTMLVKFVMMAVVITAKIRFSDELTIVMLVIATVMLEDSEPGGWTDGDDDNDDAGTGVYRLDGRREFCTEMSAAV